MQAYNEYTFTCREGGERPDIERHGFGHDKEITVMFTTSDEAQWTTVLAEFLRFLGAAYGYDVGAKVDYPNKE